MLLFLLAATAMARPCVAQGAGPIVASPAPPQPIATGPAIAISLVDAVALGMRDNRAVGAAYLQRVAEKFDFSVARSRFQPKFNILLGVTRDHAGGSTSASNTVAPTGTWLLPTGATVEFSWARSAISTDGPRGVAESSSLTFAQPLLRGAGWAVNQAPVRIAALQDQIDQLALKATVADTVTQIVLAYRALLQAQQQVALAETAVARAEDLVKTNQALIDAGRLAAADILQTRADAASQRLAALQARQQRASAQLALLRLLALDLHINIVASDPIAPQKVLIDLDALVGLARANRMDILAQRAALEQDRAALRIARSNRLWDLSIVGGVRRDKGLGVLSGLPESSSSIGLQLSIPLGDRTLEQGEVRARTALQVDETRLADLDEALEAQVLDAVAGVKAAWEQLEASREARALAGEALQLAGEKLKAGRASSFEVLSSEASLRTAEAQELNAGIAYLNALTTLDQEVGGTLVTWRIDLHD